MAPHRTAFVYRQRIRITSLTSPLFSSIPGALLQLLRRYGFPAAKMKLPCKADRCNILTERWETIISREKQVSKRKRGSKFVAVLGGRRVVVVAGGAERPQQPVRQLPMR